MKTTNYQGGDASVQHVEYDGGKHHAVGINLRVLIQPDGKFWYAQGLEVDYGAQGSTAEEAKTHFQKGLAGTIKLHLQKHGNIDKFLRRVGPAIWNDALANNAKVEDFSQISYHSIDAENSGVFPYQTVEYYRTKAA